MMHRILIAFAAGFLALAIGASAYAFECYNANRSEQGNASATKSQALMSIEEILTDPTFEIGLCQAGADYVIAGLDQQGFKTDILINFRTLMASGLEKTGKEDKLHDGQGIDHLSAEFFALGDALIGQAFGICEGGGGK